MYSMHTIVILYNNADYTHHTMVQQKNIVLDSCVVIGMIEKKGVAAGLRNSLRGKSVRIILCDIVLQEVGRVRGLDAKTVISRVSRAINRDVVLDTVDDSQRAFAENTTHRYEFCHRGDNLILALCQAKEFVLLTFDKMLLQACNITGVMAFHPAHARGI